MSDYEPQRWVSNIGKGAAYVGFGLLVVVIVAQLAIARGVLQ